MHSGKCALLIERHPWLRQTLRTLLIDCGIDTVQEATSVMEGVRLAVDTHPDLVVVDTDLAEMSGSLLGELIQMLVPQTEVVLLVDDSWEYRQLADDKRVAACIDKRAVGQLLAPAIKLLFAKD